MTLVASLKCRDCDIEWVDLLGPPARWWTAGPQRSLYPLKRLQRCNTHARVTARELAAVRSQLGCRGGAQRRILLGRPGQAIPPRGHHGVSQSICARGIRARVGRGRGGTRGVERSRTRRRRDAKLRRAWQRQLPREGPSGAVGPSWMPLYAARCRPLQRGTCNLTSLLTLLGFWQSWGRGFDSPQLHQEIRGVGVTR